MSRHSHPKRNDRRPAPAAEKVNWLYGLHAVRAAWLNPLRRCHKLLLVDPDVFVETVEEAKRLKLVRPNPEKVDRAQVEKMLPGAVHQGIALDAAAPEETSLEDVLRAAEPKANACVVILDQVTDPHNVGAILRSAAAFGALAVIVQERNAPPLTGVLAKVASGAVDVTPLVRVGNLARAMDDLKEGGFWTVGFAESGSEVLGKADISGKIALVMGAEGEGMRRLTMDKCDLLVKLPTLPPIGSLNVSNAAAVALYEVARRRTE